MEETQEEKEANDFELDEGFVMKDRINRFEERIKVVKNKGTEILPFLYQKEPE